MGNLLRREISCQERRAGEAPKKYSEGEGEKINGQLRLHRRKAGPQNLRGGPQAIAEYDGSLNQGNERSSMGQLQSIAM